MPLRWFESDGTTPLGQLDLSSVGPGESYIEKHDGAMQAVLKNTGPTDFTGVAIEIAEVASFPMNEYIRIATGDTEPSPETFSDHEDADLAIGNLANGASVKVWVDLVVPMEASRQLAQLTNLRAYGEET